MFNTILIQYIHVAFVRKIRNKKMMFTLVKKHAGVYAMKVEGW